MRENLGWYIGIIALASIVLTGGFILWVWYIAFCVKIAKGLGWLP